MFGLDWVKSLSYKVGANRRAHKLGIRFDWFGLATQPIRVSYPIMAPSSKPQRNMCLSKIEKKNQESGPNHLPKSKLTVGRRSTRTKR